MRPAAKHWLLLIFLAVTLAAMIAFALWQIGKARERPRPAGEQHSSAAAADGVRPCAVGLLTHRA